MFLLRYYKDHILYIKRNVGCGIYLTCKYFIDMRPNCFSDSFELIGNQCARVTSSFYYANWATSAQHKSFLRVIDRNGDFNACSNMTQFFSNIAGLHELVCIFIYVDFIYILITTSFAVLLVTSWKIKKIVFLQKNVTIGVSRYPMSHDFMHKIMYGMFKVFLK